MSTEQQNTATTAPEPSTEIRLGRRRSWKIPATVTALVVAGAVTAAVLGSGGGGERAVEGSHFGPTLRIAYEADSGSEKAFLQYLDQSVAPRYGLHIDPVGIGDGNQLDLATADGQYAANIYQHQHWLKQVTDKTGWKLTGVAPVFQWAYSVYSAKHSSLDSIPNGGTIALLNDPANTAQALWLLQRAGKVTFKPGTNPWEATVADIADNPRGYHFTFIDYGAGPRLLPEVDAVIAYNFQFISAGIDQKNKIYAPPAPREFAGQLVVGSDYLNDPQILKLVQVFQDPQVQQYLATTSDPALKDQLSPVSSS